jgi:hypothetical protein
VTAPSSFCSRLIWRLRETQSAGYFCGLIFGDQKAIYAVDRAPANQQSEQQSDRQRGDHFPDVEIRAVHARAQ